MKIVLLNFFALLIFSALIYNTSETISKYERPSWYLISEHWAIVLVLLFPALLACPKIFKRYQKIIINLFNYRVLAVSLGIAGIITPLIWLGVFSFYYPHDRYIETNSPLIIPMCSLSLGIFLSFLVIIAWHRTLLEEILKDIDSRIRTNWKNVYSKLKEANPDWDGKYEFNMVSLDFDVTGEAKLTNFKKTNAEAIPPRIGNNNFIVGLCFKNKTALTSNFPKNGIVKIRDIGALKILPLVELELPSSMVQNLDPLKGMENLQLLDISYTPVKDISPLKSLESLQTFLANSTQIDNLEALADKKIKSIDIAGTPAEARMGQ